ncbi:MAG TPA: type I methionyl aminopeptidase [Candidatus Polarisedimenticolia bacterium]|nr:type I methionyl aminopeptidase [Candidatus Polarisedimenticolia bacterium]
MIIYKSAEEIEKMDRSHRVVTRILAALVDEVEPGVTTMDLEKTADRMIRESGARPAFKGYRGYPCVLCTSINDEVVHGIPSPRRVLREGDIVGLDFGVVVDGYYGDSAVTVPVGRVSAEATALMQATREALYEGIGAAKAGARILEIGTAVQRHVESKGYSVVRDFVGHGIGTSLHEDPQVPNYKATGPNPIIHEGLVIAIEPMVNAGGPAVQLHDDGWTASTVDGSLSAHFERAIAITAQGTRLLGGDAEVI